MASLAWNYRGLLEEKEKVICIGWYGMFIISLLLLAFSLLDALVGLV